MFRTRKAAHTGTAQTQTAWPKDVTARYLTVGGATVDITDHGEETQWRYEIACLGCPMTDETTREDNAHRWSQSHAETCRALPRPEAVS